ncbi:MAG: hypothetical protein H6722_32830 [Sandaracinus sp.]|nr:hypothetical protein [Sandaracinus sp.]
MRLKIIAGNLVAVLLVGLGSFFYLRAELEGSLGARIDHEISGDGEVVSSAFRLNAFEFMQQVAGRAQQREIRLAYGALDENSRRTRAHEQANGIAAWFQDPSRGRGGRPDLVVLTDETGRVIARDTDVNRLNGTNLVQTLPSVRRVLAGEPAHDAWMYADEGKLLAVAMAPVRNEEGGVIGALVVGYDISNGMATRLGQLVDRKVAFVREGRVYSSNLGNADALNSALGGDLASAASAAAEGSASSAIQTDLGGASYVGTIRRLPLTASQPVTLAVLGDRTEAMAPAASAKIILILMAVGVLLVLVYGFLVGTSLLKPLEAIEEGVLTIINGRTDVRIDVESQEFGGLAYRINQLVNMFTGTEETDEEGRSVGMSGNFAAVDESGGPGSGTSPAAPAAGGGDEADAELAAKLAAEPEADYHARVYREYVAAKQAAGEDVSNIPEDRFIQRLQKNAESLVAKNKCRMVRFEVVVKGDQVTLRPVIIR